MPLDNIELNNQFNTAFDIMENTRGNLLITGKAGTGKSTFLEYFRSKTIKEVAVLAPTGVAALNVRGQTIHSFFKFKPGITVDTVSYVPYHKSKIYRAIDMVIIDEVSMVRADMMDCIDKFLKMNRGNRRPFGGVQMVLIGDPYQLPPVVTSSEAEIFASVYESPYFFDSDSYKGVTFNHVDFEKVYRQKDDTLLDILNAIRVDRAGNVELAVLNDRVDPNFRPKADSLCVCLTTTRDMAARINQVHLDELDGKEQRFTGRLDGDFPQKDTPTDLSLTLKIGAQVMLLSNNGDKWVNGTIAKVVSFGRNVNGNSVFVELPDGMIEEVSQFTWDCYKLSLNEFSNKLESRSVGTFSQFPIKLAKGITVHKSQGSTFDEVVIDLGRGAFSHGQVYVALSRCRTLDGITLKRPIVKEDIWMDERIVNFMNKLSPVEN